jgi:hypothetical protein
MSVAQKEKSHIMGRPTLPIIGEVIEEWTPIVNDQKQLVTIKARITTGPSHVRKQDNGANRELDIQIPLATVGDIVSMVHLGHSAAPQKTVTLPRTPKHLAEVVAIRVFERIEGSREISEVHTATCPAARSHPDQVPHEATVSSRDEVRELIYPHADFEYDPSDAAMTALYDEDVLYHACVSKKLT